jgi:hypothetical protein
VLWIGYLQWHFRTHGHVNPPQPVIKAFDNIECRDAVLDYDRVEYKMDDETGRPVMRWDGKTYKISPTTGEDIPDESAQVPEEVYINPRKAEWPEADYVIGNPPFIGASGMRRALGDGYVDALRKTWKEVPESSDFVMYWWNKAADLVRNGGIHQFGLITTNSLRQTFNRRIIQRHMNDKGPMSLAFAIPDHPWVDASEGAAVRIAMTVGVQGEQPGALGQILRERKTDEEARRIEFRWKSGKLHSNLAAGANTSSVESLRSNSGISHEGIKPHGMGFLVSESERADLLEAESANVVEIVKPYVNGRDIAQKPRGLYIIDLFGLTAEEVRSQYPTTFQIVYEKVKPERDQNKRETYRNNWWLFGEPRREWREAANHINSYIATVKTSRHRFFIRLPSATLADSKIICVALDNRAHFGTLCSRLHVSWSISTGGFLGAGNDQTYVKSRCFETFPFPALDEARANRIGQLAEQLDAHRKRQQNQHPCLTMTGMYNVLEKLRRKQPLTEKDKEIHEQGLVSVLRELHDDLDRAVFAAYGWDDLADKLVGRPGATTPWPEKPEDQLEADEELLQRLVDLNHERAAEEARGKVRWLRPEYQAPEEVAAEQGKLETTSPDAAADKTTRRPADKTTKLPWPKTLQARIRAVRDQLETAPVDPDTLAARFKRKPEKSVAQVLDALTDLGMIKRQKSGTYRLREG